ncbi:MAG: acetyl-CoA carboxylase biotin carboxyl carrier protein subunit [Pseudomonadota bacterium]
MARIEVRSEVTGKVWKIESSVGSKMDADEPMMIIESMKMEIPVCSEEGGTIVELLVAEGDSVEDGQVVAIVES